MPSFAGPLFTERTGGKLRDNQVSLPWMFADVFHQRQPQLLSVLDVVGHAAHPWFCALKTVSLVSNHHPAQIIHADRIVSNFLRR